MQKIEVTVVIAFNNVPDGADLENIAVSGISNDVHLVYADTNAVVSGAKFIAHETIDVIGQEYFVVEE